MVSCHDETTVCDILCHVLVTGDIQCDDLLEAQVLLD